MFTWTVELCPKSGNVTSINQLPGKKLPLEEPKVIRGAKSMSILVNAKDILQAHNKCLKVTKQMSMYEGF